MDDLGNRCLGIGAYTLLSWDCTPLLSATLGSTNLHYNLAALCKRGLCLLHIELSDIEPPHADLTGIADTDQFARVY